MKSVRIPMLGLSAVAVMYCVGCSPSEPADKQQQLEELRRQRTELDARIAELEQQTGPGQADSTAQRRVPVNVMELQPGTFRHFITVQGTVTTDRLAQVSPKTPGVVTRILVQEGDRVSAGQTLAELDNSVAEAQLQSLQTQYEFARTVYEKQKRVWEQKAGSEIEYLRAKNNMEALGRQVDAAKEQVAMGTIRAPFAGVVDRVVPKIGEAVSPGVEAFRVVNLSNLRVEAEVSEAYLGKIQRGDRVLLRFPDVNTELEAKVATVSQAVNTTNRTFSVNIPLPGVPNGVRPNMISVVRINDVTAENALMVPINAIRTIDGKSYVFVVDSGGSAPVARMREIATGLSSEGEIQVTSGLQAGDRVVTTGLNDLADGDIVRPM